MSENDPAYGVVRRLAAELGVDEGDVTYREGPGSDRVWEVPAEGGVVVTVVETFPRFREAAADLGAVHGMTLAEARESVRRVA